MQLSIIGAARTSALLRQAGLQARVVDFSFFELAGVFEQAREQIARVEQQDAYHLELGEPGFIVTYLWRSPGPIAASCNAQPSRICFVLQKDGSCE